MGKEKGKEQAFPVYDGPVVHIIAPSHTCGTELCLAAVATICRDSKIGDEDLRAEFGIRELSKSGAIAEMEFMKSVSQVREWDGYIYTGGRCLEGALQQSIRAEYSSLINQVFTE